jgi:hypothetical protein
VIEARAAVGPPALSGFRTTRAALLAAAALAAVAWPLATYTLSLAAIGVVHVLCELRYVDRRFGARVERRLRLALLATLAAIVAGRLARRAGVVDAEAGALLELGLGLALVVAVLPALARGRRAGLAVAVAAAVGLALAVGAALAPATALLAIAVLHNLTPVGLLAEATTGAARRRALAGAALVFVGVPLVILSGAPFELLARLGVPAPEASVLPAGPLYQHLRAYLPADVLDRPWALHAFTACVFLQCAHYVYVIDVLPRTLPAAARGTVRWPTGGLALAALAGAALVALLAFADDFADARARYGALAALHAWLEVPILLLALAPLATASSQARRA